MIELSIFPKTLLEPMHKTRIEMSCSCRLQTGNPAKVQTYSYIRPVIIGVELRTLLKPLDIRCVVYATEGFKEGPQVIPHYAERREHLQQTWKTRKRVELVAHAAKDRYGASLTCMTRLSSPAATQTQRGAGSVGNRGRWELKLKLFIVKYKQ